MEELKILEIREDLLNQIKNLTDSYAFEEVKNGSYTNYELYKILEQLEEFEEMEKENLREKEKWESFELELEYLLRGKKVYCVDNEMVLSNEMLYEEYKEFYEDGTVEDFLNIILDRNSNCVLV